MVNEYRYRRLEINGGTVTGDHPYHLHLPETGRGYADAQIDDLGVEPRAAAGRGGRLEGHWRPGTELSLRARFSHSSENLVGTAGFGFWNAPWGDPTIRGVALPQATWFFNASEPTDLPFALERQGRGWFAATIDVSWGFALLLTPLAPAILLLNQMGWLRHKLWPSVRRKMKISYFPIEDELTEWHDYSLAWLATGCNFAIDGLTLFRTEHSPRGPLGFVCWIDNQYLIATNRGRLKWGVLSTPEAQWLEVDDIQIRREAPQGNVNKPS